MVRHEHLRRSPFFHLRRCLVSAGLRGILRILCKADLSDYISALDRLRDAGYGSDAESPYPAPILVFNHINFLEVPMLVAFAWPRLVTGLVQSKAWKNAFMAFLFDSYAAIPIDREGSYFQTFRQVHNALKGGFFVAIAPEGTRSGTGVLGRGKAGVVQLALVSGAPILPLGHFGGQHFWQNLKGFRRTPFRFNVGRPFRFKCEGRPGKTEQEEMLTELMGQIAALLPEELRGAYAEEAGKPTRYLDFL
jgi:1-acyl-sn-glycerol-3-phosphate acyltransferase